MRMLSRRQWLASVASCVPANAFAQHGTTPHVVDPDDYARWPFRHRRIVHDVWSRGTGPGVVVLHELPGPTAEHFHFVEQLVAENFRVHVPIFFGTPGRKSSTLRTIAASLTQCIATSDFTCWDRERVSPIHDWLVALCGALGTREPGPLGAIGMCLTGVMPLVMLRARNVVAPVLCQPTLPIGVPSALGLLPSDLEHARVRAQADDLQMLLLRYVADPRCPQARVDALRTQLGGRLRVYENRDEDQHHSTLVHDPDPVAFAETVSFLRAQLARPHPGATP